MKPIILMITFTVTILITSADSTEKQKNSILNENLNEDHLIKHTSKIQRRSIFRFLGLKPRYTPIRISVNWGNPDQKRLKNSNNNPWNSHRINTRPCSFHIQKNIFIFNGLNHQTNNKQYPAIKLSTSTTPRSSVTKSYVVKTKPTISTEYSFSRPSTEKPEITTSTHFSTSTVDTASKKNQAAQNVENVITTQMYQVATSTTSKPRTESPRTVNTKSVPTTESTLSTITNDFNTKESTKGGFTSTSMPDSNQFSELIYDIDPRYRIR